LTQSNKITKIKFVTKIKTNISALEDQNIQYSQKEILCVQTQTMTLATKQKQDQNFPQQERIRNRKLAAKPKIDNKN